MATEHVKVYEDRKRGRFPVWAWLLPLLILLGLLAWFLLHHRGADQAAQPSSAPSATATGTAGPPATVTQTPTAGAVGTDSTNAVGSGKADTRRVEPVAPSH